MVIVKKLFPRHQKPKYALFDFANVVSRALFAGNQDEYLITLSKMLLKYRKRFPSFQFVFFLEGAGSARRREIFPGYKANRGEDRPIELLSETGEILRHLNCQVVQAPEGEADDAIAAFVKRIEDSAAKILIISEDRDLWQLISKKTHIITKRGEVSPEGCRSLLGILPENVVLYKALFGDSSDGIPRVPRAKSAVLLRLAKECKTLTDLSEAMKTDTDSSWIPANDRKRLAASQEQININYQLVQLRSHLPLSIEKNEGNSVDLFQFLLDNGAYLDVEDAQIISGERKEGKINQ